MKEFEEVKLQLISLDEADPKFKLQQAVASFLFMVMPIDGETHPKEIDRLRRILHDDFDLTNEATQRLITSASGKKMDDDAINKTAEILKAGLTKTELLTLVSHMWEMVFADGVMHEMEIYLVERLAACLEIPRSEVSRLMTS